MRDKLYYEWANGRYEAWTYSDGRTVYVTHSSELDDIIRYAHKHDYQLIHVQ